jgi:hypothetical protein
VYVENGYFWPEAVTQGNTVDGGGGISADNFDGTSTSDDIGFDLRLTITQVATQRAAEVHMSADLDAGSGGTCQLVTSAITY